MKAPNKLLTWAALAVGGVLATTADARAWHHDSVYRSKTVVRGAPAVPVVPVVGGTVRTGTESFFVTGGGIEFSPVVRSGFGTEFFPIVRTGGGGRESSLTEAGPVAKGSGSGGGGTVTPPPATTVCPEVLSRLKDVENKLDKLETRLIGIEQKVDALIAERERRMRVEEQARFAETIISSINASQARARAENNAALIGLIEEMTKPADKQNKDKIDGLRRALITP
jgi:hypothetical protein